MVLFTWTGRCVHKITGMTVTEKQNECLLAAAVGGGSASQGSERQPSEAAHSVLMTLFLLLCHFHNTLKIAINFILLCSC